MKVLILLYDWVPPLLPIISDVLAICNAFILLKAECCYVENLAAEKQGLCPHGSYLHLNALLLAQEEQPLELQLFQLCWQLHEAVPMSFCWARHLGLEVPPHSG